MNITLRLYWVHDYDLIGLADSPDISLSKCAKQVLLAYARNDKDFRICVPENSQVREKKTNRIIHFRIDPDNPEEKDAYAAYHKIDRGVRNSAIKNMIRMYMDKANFQPYLSYPSSNPNIFFDDHEAIVNRNESCLISEAKNSHASEPKKTVGFNNRSEAKGSDPAPDEKSVALSALDDSAYNRQDTYETQADTSDQFEVPDIFDWFDQNLE